MTDISKAIERVFERQNTQENDRYKCKQQ